jgi:hypothetical protein
MNEMNRKIDLMNQREANFEKKFESMEKHLGRLICKSKKVTLFIFNQNLYFDFFFYK